MKKILMILLICILSSVNIFATVSVSAEGGTISELNIEIFDDYALYKSVPQPLYFTNSLEGLSNKDAEVSEFFDVIYTIPKKIIYIIESNQFYGCWIDEDYFGLYYEVNDK